jgi:hypothetical protein
MPDGEEDCGVADRVEVTPEWLAENEAKQLNYALGRKKWLEQHEKVAS